ncbi:MAG: cell division protein FtsZ [Candidatus Korarchaeota archaeon]|nr:cell division protein FtsZ [Candidatus Korarchaeota archaeon]
MAKMIEDALRLKSELPSLSSPEEDDPLSVIRRIMKPEQTEDDIPDIYADVLGASSPEVGEANIVIVGVGGAGCNTVNTIMKVGITGAKAVAINTDKKHLDKINAHMKVLIGESITGGLGAGGYPEIGRACAEKDAHLIAEALGKRPDLVFIAAGMGGGTGTGAAPVVAKIAKDKGAIVIAVVTLPFKSEGKPRMAKAVEGVKRLAEYSDTIVTIYNDKLLRFKNLPLDEAFAVADYFLAIMVKGITEIITKRALVNVDYADIRALMSTGGLAAVGIGEASGRKGERVEAAIRMAMENPLVDFKPDGARGAILVVLGGKSMTLEEVHKAAEIVSSKLAPNAVFKWGADIDSSLGDRIRVILLFSGIRGPNIIIRQKPRVPAIVDPTIRGLIGVREEPEPRERVLQEVLQIVQAMTFD